MSLLADLRARRGSFRLEVRLDIASGETVALLGPNGAGKSTLVRALAGLLPLDDGEVTQDGLLLESPSKGIRLPPGKRSVGVLFQDLLLFPHLSARENVAYGPRARGCSRGEADRIAAGWLDKVGAAGVAASFPSHLSGGEARRVALARALATEPRMLLLDEPLSSLDVEAKRSVSRLLRTSLKAFGGAKVLVTHDPVEALTLADRLVIIEGGRVVQEGTGAEVRRRPRSQYVASFVGLNLLAGILRSEGGHALVRGSGGEVHAAACDEPDGTEVVATIHPRSIAVAIDRPAGSPRNVLCGPVRTIDRMGETVRLWIETRPPLTAEVTTEAFDELALQEGSEVWVSFKAAEVQVYAK
jgi:molybdate transport system ATP-binding protein